MADNETEREPTPKQAQKTAEQKVEEARQALEAAQSELAASQGELRAAVYRDVPKFVCEVVPNAVIVHEGKAYHGAEYGIREDDDSKNPDRMLHGEDHGTEVTLDGPTAMALVMQGQVKIVRSE